MQRWEYRLVVRSRNIVGDKVGSWDVDVQTLLPQLGEEGWELVSVSPRASESGEERAGVSTGEVWVFKRPRE